MNQPVKLHIPILILVVLTFFAACKENGDLMISGKLSNLNIVNATADTLNVYQNGARLNDLSTIGPGSQTGYTSITANATSFEVKKAGQANYLIGSYAATLDTNRYYSLFIAGETADKLFITNDATPVDSVTSANVRFVNASPSATNVDVKIDKLTFSNIAFKIATPFRYDPVSVTLPDTATVIVYPHGSTVTPIASGRIPLSVNTNYTIYLQGVPGGTGNNIPVLKANIN